MSISPISTAPSYANSGAQSASQQQRNEFQQLSQSLQAGNLAGAQKAYSALTQNSSGSSATPSFLANQKSPLAQDFQAIGTALESGNLQGAQTAFAQLQKDASTAQSSQTQGASGAHRGHHHHHASSIDADSSGSTAAASTTTSSIPSSSPATSSSNSTTGTVVNLLA